MTALDARDIHRYRKQRGVNLGSWFVLEKWITPKPFVNTQGSSDLDVAKSANAKQILEAHWDNWITPDDWVWLRDRGINAVRVPIGYYHLAGPYPEILKGTDFNGLGPVFEGAWTRITRAIATAGGYGMGVLIDLHSAVGKQNGDAHSGAPGPIRFYEKRNMDQTLNALKFLAQALDIIPNVIGLQLINEPQNNPALPSFYSHALDTLRKLAPDLPLYIHDAWNTDQYAELVSRRKDFVVLDHHLYRCFTSEDQNQSGDDHARNLRGGTLGHFKGISNKIAGNLVVAEYSAALNQRSLRSGDAGEQDRQRRVFTAAQLDLYNETCGGSFFWCYKKQEGWDAGWDLRNASLAEIMPSFYGIRKTSQGIHNDAGRREDEKRRATNDHVNWWNKYPGHYEHWRFELGFQQGWDDAFVFFNFRDSSASVSEIGFRGQLARRRSSEHIREKGESNVWEYGESI
ncbi:glycoside hydrolase [Sistotremastrum niveocremeum HHB9708]|uniref:Glycoside hydrolase n=1 Tax=Sistotremastrum niveocremeum HHB9708 TaxID=1314777 RepID=A0A164S4S1_9AGAM|nr:glycoside hydrolase [Sistotremastrum niveocremeum HHB9708]